MTLYGPPPGRRCCCNCGADLGPDTDPPPPHRVIDACGWPLDFCEGCWERGEDRRGVFERALDYLMIKNAELMRRLGRWPSDPTF